MKKENKKLDESEFTTNIGIAKKVILSIFLFFIIFIIALFILEKAIKLENIKDENNKYLSEVITEEINKNIVKEDDKKIETSLSINGKMMFRSFLMPHILITKLEGKNLIENNFNIDFSIEKIKLYLSLEDLIKQDFIVKRIEIIGLNFNSKELNNDTKLKTIDTIIKNYIDKLNKKSKDLKISIKNSNIVINGIEYKRELSNINITGNYNKDKFLFSGKMLSNKQELNFNLDLNRVNDDFDGKINLNSQAFSFDTTLKINFKNKKASGTSKLNLINPQIFTRTIFDTSNFLYKRIIDNTALKIDFNFNLENNILEVNNILFDGQNIKANGEAKFNFIESQRNNVDFNIETINLDALIIKNVVSKNIDNITDKDVSIFSGIKPTQNKRKYNSFLESKLKMNPIFFNLKFKEIQFNKDKITDLSLDFSYSDDYKYNFYNVYGKLPGETELTIKNENKNQLLNIKGNDIKTFWNFIKNTIGTYSKSKDEKKIKFDFSGVIIVDGDRLFINNAIFSTDNTKSESTIEMKFDSGISFIAIDTKIGNLLLDNLIDLDKQDNNIYINTLKNKILFLNSFTLNTFLRFKIDNIKYKNFSDINYNFIIRTSQGLLSINNINLNNKISGGIVFDIQQLKPKINSKLAIQNTGIKENVDLNEILFKLPTLEDFYGNINIVGKNLTFKNSFIDNFEIVSTIQNGLINFNKFEVNGFGGKCRVNGFLDMQFNRKLNLTFGGCTADLKDLLNIFAGINNTNGIIGFSSVLYTEGQNLETFINNYVVKSQFVAGGITVNKFGLEGLSNDLLKINTDEVLLNSLNPELVLYNENNKTIFEKISKGTIQYSKKSGGMFAFDLSRPMINGRITGKFDLFTNYIKLDLNSNFVMLSGTLEKTIPLNLAIAITGNTNEKLGIATNFQNVDSYISSIKKHFEELKKQENNTIIVEEPVIN